MAEPIYGDSVFRFTDPLRYFKANDPYYFEVDNIPLKQLQENCLWLKDQLTKSTQGSLGVKRGDLDELRPYANGGDRVLRVKPGRFTARINDASTKEPLQFLNKVFGIGGQGWGTGGGGPNTFPEYMHRVSAWEAAMGSPGSWPDHEDPSWNTILYNSLEKFKSNLAQDALGMTGLVERVFTWPTRGAGMPIDGSGVPYAISGGRLTYMGPENPALHEVHRLPLIATEALLWAQSDLQETFMATTYDQEGGTGSTLQKWAMMPLTENQLIKRWRGITRNAIVDVPDEITVQVPLFDSTDFDYIDEDGNEQSVAGVQSRIDMVFIYSKPVDASGIKYVQGTAIHGTTTPILGIVRGAGIKMKYDPITNINQYWHVRATDSAGNTQILAAPGDVNDTNLGFTSTSANDIAYDIRGSFPSPDDILNIAPLIEERLVDSAIELVGQSILPVAYVWVQADSSLVATTDIIDIRPLFRTAELSYNERAGIAAAVPQISLANPVCSLSLMENRSKNLFNYFTTQIEQSAPSVHTTRTVAAGYIFGGWNFGPEGALYDFEFKNSSEEPRDPITGSDLNIGATNPVVRNTLANKYHFGGGDIDNVPDYPDWEIGEWTSMAENNLTDVGYYPVDYTTPYMSLRHAFGFGEDGDPSIVGGSISGRAAAGYSGARLKNTFNTENGPTDIISRTFFNYCKKRINFIKPSWLLDYSIDVELVNCVGQNYNGARSQSNSVDWAKAGTYFGCWVEKGKDYFIIYYAWNGDEINARWGPISRYHIQVPIEGTDGVIYTERTTDYASEAYAGGFLVPVQDILESNTDKMRPSEDGIGGYMGNPRVGKCSLPTVSWKMTAVGVDDAAFLYTNLNNNDPTITLNGA